MTWTPRTTCNILRRASVTDTEFLRSKGVLRSCNIFTILILAFCPPHLSAQEQYSTRLCPAGLDIPDRPTIEEILDEGDTFITADTVDLIEEGISHLEGNAEIAKDNKQVSADIIDYNSTRETADLEGNVNYWDEALYLQSSKSHLELDIGSGTFKDANYRLIDIRGRGTADELFIDAGSLSRGKNIEFSTCDPETGEFSLSNNFWKINAKELVLNHETDRGTGKHAIIKIKDIPVFYTPYITFPLGLKRKSGFLMPSFGSSNNNGVDIRTPYYWNIAPNMDATFTPRLLTDSGLMGMGEYRYLFERGSGIFNVEYLASDANFNDLDRSYIDFEHSQSFGRTGKLSLIYKRVSDREYFEDLGTQLTTTSRRFLQRLANVSYRGSWWNASARVQNFQIVDNSIAPTSRPYQRLPQIRFRAFSPRGKNKLNFELSSELSHFERAEDILLDNSVNGFRMDLFPSVSYPLRTKAAFFTPKLGIRYTQYALTDEGPFKETPSRVLPSFSVDSGIFLEKDMSLFGDRFLHTIEPRLFYLYVPEENQDNLPVFDTKIFNLSYNQLFRNDRFSGADRMGDSNQITLAVTSRLINRTTGRRYGYIRVGQSFYLADQDVIRQRLNNSGNLVNNGAVNTNLLSPFVAELGWTPSKSTSLTAELHYDPNDNITQKLDVRAQYRPEEGKVVNLAYRVRRAPSGVIRRNTTDIEQTDVSLRWPMSRDWSVVGRWNYAIGEKKSLETFAGVEYNSCCWSLRAVGRRFLTNLRGDFQTGFFLQIQLKGLAGVGQKTVDFLNQQIPGYERGF